MNAVRKVVLVALGAAALYGMQACATDTELNPQPLPPAEPNKGDEDKRTNGEVEEGADFGGGSGTASPPAAADAGTEGGSEGGDG